MRPALPKRQHRPLVKPRASPKCIKTAIRDAYDRGWRDGQRSARAALIEAEQEQQR